MNPLRDRIVELWKARGVVLTFDGPRARLWFDGSPPITREWSEVDQGARLTSAAAATFANRLVVGERVTPEAARRIKESGGWYLDAAGNAYLRAPGILVDVQGKTSTRRRSAPTSTTDRAPETNLLSAKRAQVIFSLLTWPELVSVPRRALAHAAGVSVGIAQSTISALEQERYMLPRSWHLHRQDELLDRWSAAFPLGLGRSLELGRFTGETDLSPLAERGVEFHVSGELAVENLRGNDLTLYLQEYAPAVVAAMRWRRPDSKDEANVILRRRFWTPPPLPWQDDVEVRNTPRRAPKLLVYADLLASREPRQLEVARDLRGEILEHPR